MKIAICIPSRPLVDLDSATDISNTVALLKERNDEPLIFRTRGNSLIEQARSEIATEALEWGAHVLLWVDDDILFEAADAVKLIDLSINHQIIGAACARKVPGAPICTSFKPGTKVTFFGGGDIYPVPKIGLGITAHRRTVYERIQETMQQVQVGADKWIWPFYRSLIEDGKWWGEDNSFCIRAEKIGIQSWCYTKMRVKHRGEYDYGIEDSAYMVGEQESLTVTFES